MAQVPTITVKHPSGKGEMVINESDFDPTVHEEVRVRKSRAKAADAGESSEDGNGGDAE